MYSLNETICAIATPPGMGGVGIVRLSGSKAFEIATRIFRGKHPLEKKRAIRLGVFMDPGTGEVLDEGILLIMPAPRSYTAEDIVEFHAHGSPSLLEKIVDILVMQGAKPANPGEYTYRAFMNGRLDLSQAEAVQALVTAQGDAARREALRQLTGGLTAYLEPIEESIKDLYLQVEARLEFPEDGLPSLERGSFERQVVETGEALVKLVESYGRGKVLAEGLKVAIVGAPNAGKSSLLNALLGRERAIVTSHPGTTRDIVEGEFLLKGVCVRLFDTAGLREAEHEIEAEGIRRSRKVIDEADVVLWVVDAMDPTPGIQESHGAYLPEERSWYLFNKVDLIEDPGTWNKELGVLPEKRCFPISCKTEEGLEKIEKVLESALDTSQSGEDVVLLSARHKKEAEEAILCLVKLGEMMMVDRPLELWAEELKMAAQAVGRIRGRDLTKEAFEEIFDKLCIGK